MDSNLKKVLEKSEILCNELKHHYIGTEHFIASVLEIKEYQYIFCIEHKTYKSELIDLLGKGDCNKKSQLKTPLLQKCLLNNNDIDEVLLDILEEEDSCGFRILEKCMSCDDIYCIMNILEKNINDKKKKIKNVPKYLTNLNEKEYITNPAIGRDILLENIEKTLLKMNKPNILLIGDAGVGKTAIVEGLAYNIINNKVNDMLNDKIIMSCSTSSLVAGTKYRGEFEEKIEKLCNFLKENKNIILFIDEMHTTINAGGADGAIDMANILKPYLARGDIKVIGATTLKESKAIYEDSAYSRRFTTILVEEPTITMTNKIVEESIYKFEKFYNIKIDKKLVSTFVNESRNLKGKLPDKCIDLLENVCIDILYNNDNKITKKDIARVAEEMIDNERRLSVV